MELLPYLRIYQSEQDYLNLVNKAAPLGMTENEYASLLLSEGVVAAVTISRAALDRAIDKARTRADRITRRTRRGILA